MKSILAIGELLWDLLPDGRKLGGAPANFAFRLQELGNEVAMVSRVGEDEMGKEAITLLKDAGLDTSFIQVDEHYPTGTVDVFFDEQKNPDYHINTGVAYDFIETTEELLKKASSVDCLAFGTLAQSSETTKATIHKLIDQSPKAIKFCDINLRKDCYSLESVASSMNMANIVKINHNELIELSLMFDLDANDVKSCHELVQKFNLDLCLVTYEEYGSLAVDRNNAVYSPGYDVRLEDALGAGDAFSAAFVHTHLLNRLHAESLNTGNLYGAMVAMQRGAMQPLDLELIIEMADDGRERVIKDSLKEYINDKKLLFL